MPSVQPSPSRFRQRGFWARSSRARRTTVALVAAVATAVALAPATAAGTPPPPTVGDTSSVLNFDDGSTGNLFGWGSDGPATPTLATVAADVPGTETGNQAVSAAVEAVQDGGWSGFSLDLNPATDWSDYDGFSFAFLGTGSGANLRFEVKSGGIDAGNANLFETTVADDAAGWRTVSADFGSLRLKGNPESPVRFDPASAHGFAVTLTDLGAGDWRFDEFALYQRTSLVQDFEGDVPIGADTDPIGWFTWGSNPGTVSLGVTEQDRGDVAGNHVLSGQYQVPSGGWGGISNNLAASQDWSAYGGIRFYWYASQPTPPASPTAGADIPIEIKDGGPDAEHSELWTTTFKDNWSADGRRWKLVEIPFSQFTLRGDFQPGTGDTLDGVFSRTDAWGFAVTFPPGTAEPVGWAIDQVELYGTATPASTATVTADPGVTLVDGGDQATVRIGVTTPDAEPLPADVTVDYAPGDGTAEGGSFNDFGGTLTFPAGTESGTTQDITVQTHAVDAADTARTIPITLDVTGGTAPADDPVVVINAHGLTYLDADLPVAQRVDDLMGRMSQAEKIGQMTQAERLGLQSPAQITDLRLGSVLSGGGSVPADNTPRGWADMIDGFQGRALATPLQIPIVYGVDAVHGHNNVVGATILPHNIGFGAARDPELVTAAGRMTATEVRATGIPWTFAPCLCVTRDERWGRSYESFSEDPALVSQLAGPAVVGLQGDDPTDITGPTKVLATIKHWAGDGGTSYDPSQAGSGYPIDQGITHADSLAAFEQLHVSPYLPAIEAGAGSIMPSYSAVQIGDGPVIRMHEYTELNTDLLKDELGFDGFMVSDWEGINKLPGGTYADKAARSVNSGLDMAMAPYDFGTFIASITDKVDAGEVQQSRIDDAVRRILTEKFELGLFEQPFADRSMVDTIGSAEHRAIARQAAAKSQVLLKNDADLLPLPDNASIYLAGSNADDLGNQMGGWSISWQGGSGATTDGTTIAQGIAEVAPDAQVTYSKDASAAIGDAEVGVVVVGETPYAEGVGDVGNNGHSLTLSTADRNAIDTVCGAVDCVVLVVSGRPQLLTDRLPEIDAAVASWLPGSEGAGVADVLFGERPFTGRLPVSWPAAADQLPLNVGDADFEPLFPYGWGLRTDGLRDRLETIQPDLPARARAAVKVALTPAYWNGQNPRGTDRVLASLSKAAAGLGDGPRTAEFGDVIASVARDMVQDTVLTEGATPDGAVSTLIAGADHDLASGDPAAALVGLVRAWKLVV